MATRHIEGLEALPAGVRGAVLTIGNFDGVHRGHQRILITARALADAAATPVVALTFEPPPDRVLRPADVPQRITPAQQRAELLLAAGADQVVTARTDHGLLALSPGEFIQQVIVERFAPQHVVEGDNFSFGAGRSGTAHTLARAGEAFAFTVHVVDAVLADLPEGPTRVSSTLVRRLISDGRIPEANGCLGRPYTLFGRVVPGEGRGKALGFPTVNLDCGQQVRPAPGVYAGTAAVGAESFAAAVSVGQRPTFASGIATVEAFLIDAKGDYYGRPLALSLLSRLRDQCRFVNAEALRAQIENDVQKVREDHGSGL